MRGPTKALTGKTLVVQIQLQVVVAYKRWSHMEVFRTVLNLYTGNLTAGEYFWFSFPVVSCESSKGLCSWKRKIFSDQPYLVALPSSAQFKLNCNIIMLCFNSENYIKRPIGYHYEPMLSILFKLHCNTSTFFETTFFTIAANRSDMSLPSAIIYKIEKIYLRTLIYADLQSLVVIISQ